MTAGDGRVLAGWADVVAGGLALPGVTVGTSYRRPALLVRGKMLAAASDDARDSFVLRVALADKEVLLATDPATFWETDHYRGWPAILVRYGTAAGDRIALLLARSWWDRATRAQRAAFGERP